MNRGAYAIHHAVGHYSKRRKRIAGRSTPLTLARKTLKLITSALIHVYPVSQTRPVSFLGQVTWVINTFSNSVCAAASFSWSTAPLLLKIAYVQHNIVRPWVVETPRSGPEYARLEYPQSVERVQHVVQYAARENMQWTTTCLFWQGRGICQYLKRPLRKPKKSTLHPCARSPTSCS